MSVLAPLQSKRNTALMLVRKLNVLVSGFHLPVGRGVIERGLRSLPVGRCIHLARPEKPLCLQADEPVRIHTGEVDGVEWESISPLDEEVIESMRGAEAVFMEMMTRLEGKGRVISYAERKCTYLKHLRYWNHFLEKEEINLYVCVSYPHRVRSYLLSALCKEKGIPALYFHHTSPIPGLFYLSYGWEESVIGLRERFEELQTHPQTEKVQLSKTLEWYFRAQTGVEGDPAPWFVHDPPLTDRELWYRMVLTVLQRGLYRFAHSCCTFVIKRMHVGYWTRWWMHRRRCARARAMFRFYDAHTQLPDLSQRYIYLPLQLQPECTTCPMAGAYVDQILMAQMLSNLLPEGVFLYVKEHPNQERLFPDGMCRDISLYEDLLAMRNVRLIPRSFDTFALIEHAIAVATATGSAGFEALFRGIPFLMFGHDYYQFAPGVFMIRTVDDCRCALNIFLQGKGKPTQAEMRLFLKALDDVTLPGYLDDDDMKKVSIVSEEQCIENLGGMLEREIKKIFAFS